MARSDKFSFDYCRGENLHAVTTTTTTKLILPDVQRKGVQLHGGGGGGVLEGGLIQSRIKKN